MKYLVMETHPGYCILLDEEGRFLKAANRGYSVGDTVQEISGSTARTLRPMPACGCRSTRMWR